MSEKKSFFNFLKNPLNPISKEEAFQRSYALEKQLEEDSFETSQQQNEESLITKDMMDFAKTKLGELLKLCGFESQIKFLKKEEHILYFEIVNEEDIGRIIGKEGATLEAFQLLLQRIVQQKFGIRIHIHLDSGDYRKRNWDRIQTQVQQAFKTARESGEKVDLEPMNASNRRMIHLLCKEQSDMYSFSVGKGENRHIVIEKKTNGRPS